MKGFPYGTLEGSLGGSLRGMVKGFPLGIHEGSLEGFLRGTLEGIWLISLIGVS
jgi:hypothetical protein